MIVVVTGSRGWRHYGIVLRALIQLPRDTLVVHGGAEGADHLADSAARLLGMPVKTYPVAEGDWQAKGRSAGPERNRRMLDTEKPDLLLAFWDGVSKGTDNCIKEAKRRGIETAVTILREEDQ